MDCTICHGVIEADTTLAGPNIVVFTCSGDARSDSNAAQRRSAAFELSVLRGRTDYRLYENEAAVCIGCASAIHFILRNYRVRAAMPVVGVSGIPAGWMIMNEGKVRRSPSIQAMRAQLVGEARAEHAQFEKLLTRSRFESPLRLSPRQILLITALIVFILVIVALFRTGTL